MTLELDELATGATHRLRGLPPPQLIPAWTTERIGQRFVSLLGRHDDELGAVTVSAVAAGGEGLVVSGGVDGTVRLWDPRSPGDPGRVVGRHEGSVDAMTVTSTGLVVSAGKDGVWLWDPHNLDDPGRELVHVHQEGVVSAVAVGDQGLLVFGGRDGTVALWDSRSPNDPGRELGRHPPPRPESWVWVTAVAVGDQGLVVSGGTDGTVRLWDPSSPDDPGRALGPHNGLVSAVAVSKDGLVVSGGSGGTVWL